MMSTCDLHHHDFLGTNQQGERRVLIVLVLTLVTMAIEIAAGFAFNSMALTADGWHMGTHAAAFGITIFAYHYARKHAKNPRFSFGTGKVSVLGGFASAVALGVVAVLMSIESIHRIISPQEIRFNEAIWVAIIGLIVNLVSAYLLKSEHQHHHGGQDHGPGHHEDHNLKAAYFHVLADATTSIAAIIALVFGRMFGWTVLDPIMGIVGSLVITKWAIGLMKETSALLLDGSVDAAFREKIRAAVEAEPDLCITDLHVWAVAPGHHAVILAVQTSNPWKPDAVKFLLEDIGDLVHVNIEVHQT
ncbi:MAG: CDF family Co(II)/Ni(II) efflux transporter DmeF [Pontiella sp.]